MQTGGNKGKDLEVLTIARSIERHCPRCYSQLVKNDNEDCYECLNCGYIECGGDKNIINRTYSSC